MSEDNSAIRLKGFIEHLGLSYSVFADECGVPRPSLSQILSGRNKKISDVLIRQIHHAFPQLSVSWLLFGEGDMLVGGNYNTEVSRNALSPESGDDVFGISSFDDADPNRRDLGAWVPDADRRVANDENYSDDYLKNPGYESGKSKYENLRALNEARKALQETKAQLDKANETIADLTNKIEKLVKNPRKVGHITIYYDDSTFETFLPK